MATIKSYTDIEQSKALAKVLPLESADMHFINDSHAGCVPYLEITNSSNPWLKGTDISPCWSLGALLDVLPDDCGIDKEDGEYVASYLISNECGAYTNDNPIDACVEMIRYLKKMNWI